MSELLSCPFCGGEAIIKNISEVGQPAGDDWWVSCGECRVERPSTKKTEIAHSREEAVAAWNQRASLLPDAIRKDIWSLVSCVSIVHHRHNVDYADRDTMIKAGNVERWLKGLEGAP